MNITDHGRLGNGRVFQGPWVTDSEDLLSFRQVTGPVAIIALNSETDHETLGVEAPYDELVDMDHCHAAFIAPFQDNPDGVLTDQLLRAYVEVGASLLNAGFTLYIHCLKGVSRSTYYHTALRMRMTGKPWDTCLAEIQEIRPTAEPKECFIEHLRTFRP